MTQYPDSPRRTATILSLLAASLCFTAQEVHGFAPTRFSDARSRTRRPIFDARQIITRFGATSEGGDGEPALILGGGAGVPGGGAAGGPTDYLSDFRAASAKRNEEAKKKLLEEAAREEEEAKARQKAREEGADSGPNESNYGPGDLSALPTILTSDDSWEASLGDDDSGLMVAGGDGSDAGGEGDADDGPGLYVPGRDDGDSPQLFIPSDDENGGGDSPIIL